MDLSELTVGLLRKMKLAQYHLYIDQLCTNAHARRYKTIFYSFPDMTMDQRSDIAKLCRAQCYPPKPTRLARMTNHIHPTLKNDILPLCQTPLTAGLVLHLILLAPMSESEVRNIYSQSMMKELTVMESVKRNCDINFSPFFGDYNEKIHWSIPTNRRVAQFIHKCVDDWIDSLRSRILFPRLGSKTVSRVTANEAQMVDSMYVPEREIGITPRDLERIYQRYGVKVTGPCEMRQKWYCSNLQPRTYYAQGGDAYHSSKYLAIPLVELCDLLPSTNRRTRVDPGRITIRDSSNDVIYYDLSSFTSNLHVQAEFMYRLASYCTGVSVNILDSLHGIKQVDLGGLIYEYTLTNLMNPSYTLPSKYSDPSVLHYHSVAGFLGVYGNIASATFIHGIVMAMRHQHFDENNVAGDDGLDVTSDVDETLQCVGLLGIVKDEKTFRDSEGCCIHLKRPISRIGNRLLHGQLITWPSLEPGEKDTDTRYPYLRQLSNRERKNIMASSITAFLRKLEHQSFDVSELQLIDTFISNVYMTNGLPREGCIPQITKSTLGFVPIYEPRFIGMDPITNTINRLYRNVARLPLRGFVEWKYEMFEDMIFECNQTKLLNHLVMLGFLEQEKLSICHFGYEGMKQLMKEYIHPDPQIYQFKVVHKLPDWVVDFSL